MSNFDKKVKEITDALDKFGDEKIRPNMEPIAEKVFEIMSKDKTKWILIGFAAGFVLCAILSMFGVQTGVIHEWGNQVH